MADTFDEIDRSVKRLIQRPDTTKAVNDDLFKLRQCYI